MPIRFELFQGFDDVLGLTLLQGFFALLTVCKVGIADGAHSQFFPMAFTMLPAILVRRSFRRVGVDDRQH
jgi:hypothetical protein